MTSVAAHENLDTQLEDTKTTGGSVKLFKESTSNRKSLLRTKKKIPSKGNRRNNIKVQCI